MVNITTPPSPLLQFPCEFIIKAFGLASDEFETAVLTIIRAHVRDLGENAIRSRLSKDNKYLALTISIMAESQDQLNGIYQAFSKNPLILMAL